MINSRQQRCGPHLPVRRDTADRDASEANTVIAALAADELGASGLAPDTVIGERNLERGVYGFGARVREEDVVESRGRDLDDRVGQRERGGMPYLKRRCVIHRLELRCDCLRNLLTPVP